MENGSLSLLLGVGTLAAILWGRGRRNVPGSGTAARGGGGPVEPLPGRWVWPVPIWKGRRPVISSGWGTPRGTQTHEGVDVMFRRLPTDPYRVGSPNGSKGFVLPEGVLAVAAADGKVWSAGWTPRGYSVVLDHGDTAKVATYYTHLQTLLLTPTTRGRSGQRVRAGEPLGVIGADPLDGNHLKHLHFAIWRGGPSSAVDPQPLMKFWELVDEPRGPSGGAGASGAGGTSGVGSANPAGGGGGGHAAGLRGAWPRSDEGDAIRNAGLVYRPVGASGERYPEWVRKLRGKSGAYIIRELDEAGNAETVYVGQSQANRLYETLTRHFQGWRRWKGFWRGQYSEGHDPGMTYRRDRVEVAVRVTSPSRALAEEARLIRKLRPRDNLIGQPADLEEAPF
ncbi:MAG: peptidoglycan DD-metalloendopeptidase family protein [Kofleriaceae bacterium]